MPTDEPVAAIPEEFIETAESGVRHLVDLTEAQCTRLIGALSAFSPSIEVGLDKEEAVEVAQSADVKMSAVAAAIGFISYLDAFGSEGAAVLRGRLSPSANERFDALLDAFAPAVVSLGRGMARVKRIARAMPTFRRLAVECDLRQVSDDSEKPELVPVAILRLEFDEGDDRVFQCTKEALGRFISRLQRAQKGLDALERLASEYSRPGGDE